MWGRAGLLEKRETPGLRPGSVTCLLASLGSSLPLPSWQTSAALAAGKGGGPFFPLILHGSGPL